MTATTVDARTSRRAGFVWFALMVGAWLAFFVLVLFSESALEGIRSAARDLPLAVEGIVWLAAFPLMLGVTVWESSWDGWLRLLLVTCFAVAWSVAFYPETPEIGVER